MRYRLGILASYPIQYQIPWFRRLAAEPELDVEIFYCQVPDASQQGRGFGVSFQWDIPLLEGYAYRVLDNVASNPSVGTFVEGCDTPIIHETIRKGRFDAFLVSGWNVKSYLQAVRACNRLTLPC